MTEATEIELSKYQVQITKVKTATGFATIEVDISATKDDGTPVYSDEVVHFIIAEGLKVFLNSRMAKVGAVTKLVGKELTLAQESAMKIANENLADLKAGKVKHSRGKAKSTIPAAVTAEAMRLAKTAIKDAVRALGLKPSHYSEKSYTSKAKEYITLDPHYIQQAKENIEARKTPSHPITLNIAELGPALPKKAKAKSNDLPAGIVGKPSGVQTTHKPTAH
jgi:hypothetical protein